MNATDQYLAAHSEADTVTGEVTDHIDRLDKAVAVLGDAAQALEYRLRSVLREPTEGPQTSVAAIAPERVPLAQRLAALESRLEAVAYGLQDVTRRCEL